ncbi:hypothetical protein Tco_0445578 [Tanacetum coccineum]
MRNDPLLDDEDGITCLTNDEIFKDLALMGSKSAGWNEFSTNLASAVICLAKGQKFNFSKLIFDGMLRNLDLKKFLMYPRFLQLFLNNQLKDLPEPFNDTYDTPSYTKKIFSNMARQSKGFSGKVTPLFDSMLVQNHAPEGEGNGYRWQSQALRNHGGALAQTRSEIVLEKPNEPPLPEGHTSRSEEGNMEHTFELMDIVPPTPHDSPLTGGYTLGSDEGRLKLKELCVQNCQNRCLPWRKRRMLKLWRSSN